MTRQKLCFFGTGLVIGLTGITYARRDNQYRSTPTTLLSEKDYWQRREERLHRMEVAVLDEMQKERENRLYISPELSLGAYNLGKALGLD